MNKRYIPIIFLLCIFALSSCKMKAEQKSLTSQFTNIDALIAQNQMKSALSELKKAEKQVYDSWSYIGIYKRYAKLNEKKSCERVIKKAVKKNPHNQELLAVYSHFLLRENRMGEAEKYAVELRGKKYGSLYSEIVLKKIEAELKAPATKKKPKLTAAEYYKDPKYYDIYLDAYRGSLNPVWIKNCAIFNLKDGYFENAAALLPKSIANADDSLFWAYVLYDAARYYESIAVIEDGKKYLRDYPSERKIRATKASEIKLIALESDAYMAVSEMENADLQRQEIITKLDTFDKLNENEEALLSMIVVNSAIYAKNTDNTDECADLLFFSVTRWPDYVPALILYCDFAYESNLERKEDMELKALRRAGLATLEMERYDSRRKIPLSDAMYRIDDSLSRQKNPYLSITKLDLKYKLDDSFGQKEKTADLWHLLEENYTEDVKYESLLVQYALSYLLKTKQTDDAYTLFVKYMYHTFNLSDKEDMWQQILKLLPQMDVKIVEFAAWFAANKNLYDETLRLYEYAVYESGGLLFEGFISPHVSTVSCMNLADFYYANGMTTKALDLYGRAAGRESKKYLRSEIFYRIGFIYYMNEDKKNALRSIDYATSIYPDNARAQLLRTKLK